MPELYHTLSYTSGQSTYVHQVSKCMQYSSLQHLALLIYLRT